MRNVFGIFGLVCGAIVVALVARYGFKTTDVETDAWIMAFLFGVIAAFGLGGHLLAVTLWKDSKFWSVSAGVVAVLALGLNLSNSLGAIAGRADKVQTAAVERNREIRSAEAELKRLQGLRDAMAPFDFADDATVIAAKRAADAATKSREAECQKRGNFCRDREADERTASATLTKATANKAASARASKLEDEIDAQRRKLEGLGPLQALNVQGNALARLFRLPDEEAGFAATAQQFAIAAIVEFIILICLVGWEVMGRKERAAIAKRASVKREAIDVTPEAVAPQPVAAIAPPVVEAAQEPVPEKLPPPPRPKLVAARKEPPAGPVPRIMTAALDPAKGQRVRIDEAFVRYCADSKAEGREPVTSDVFIDAMTRFCKAAHIKTKVSDNALYLMDVQLTAAAGKAAQK